jgi:hypothetical protein
MRRQYDFAIFLPTSTFPIAVGEVKPPSQGSVHHQKLEGRRNCQLFAKQTDAVRDLSDLAVPTLCLLERGYPIAMAVPPVRRPNTLIPVRPSRWSGQLQTRQYVRSSLGEYQRPI